EVASGRVLVKGIVHAEVRLSRHEPYGRHDEKKADAVDPRVLQKAADMEAHIEKLVFSENEFVGGIRNEHVPGEAGEGPPGISVELGVAGHVDSSVTLHHLELG